MSPKLQLSARAQAMSVLVLVATLGALLGVMGDRLLAQQRDPTPLTAPSTTGQPTPVPVDTVEPLPVPAQTTTPTPTQSVQPEPQPRPPAGAEPAPRPARFDTPYADRLFALLDLTPAQRSQIDSIMALQQQRVRALNEQMQPQFRAITRETQQQVQALLTDEQRMELRRLNQNRQQILGGQPPQRRPDARVQFERDQIMQQLAHEQQMRREMQQLMRESQTRRGTQQRPGVRPQGQLSERARLLERMRAIQDSLRMLRPDTLADTLRLPRG